MTRRAFKLWCFFMELWCWHFQIKHTKWPTAQYLATHQGLGNTALGLTCGVVLRFCSVPITSQIINVVIPTFSHPRNIRYSRLQYYFNTRSRLLPVSTDHWSLWEPESTIDCGGQTASPWVSSVCSSLFVTVFCWSLRFPPPLPTHLPPRPLPGSGAGDITNSKQWPSAGANWPSRCTLCLRSISRLQVWSEMRCYCQSAFLRECCPMVEYLIKGRVFCKVAYFLLAYLCRQLDNCIQTWLAVVYYQQYEPTLCTPLVLIGVDVFDPAAIFIYPQ